MRSGSKLGFIAHLEGGDEGGLRDFDIANLTHAFFTLFLFLK
jgi:hypothetical protein